MENVLPLAESKAFVGFVVNAKESVYDVGLNVSTSALTLFKKVKYKGIWDIKFKKSRAVKLYEPFGENRFIENLPGIVTTAIYGDIVSFLYKAETPEVIQIKNNLLAREIRGYFDKLWAISSI